MLDFFHTIFYIPLYNLLVWLVDVLPGHDLGWAVIGATIIIKLILSPLAIEAIKTQQGMKAIEPKLKELKETYKDDKEAQARKMLDLYKEHNIKPLSTMLMALIQIPILIYLYLVFNSGIATNINSEILYSFIVSPETVSALFLGFFALTEKSVLLGVIAGIAQFAHSYLSIPIPKSERKENEMPSFGAEFARSMALNARYFLPLMIGYFSYLLGGAVALYFITSSVFSALQELLILKKTRLALEQQSDKSA